MKNRALRAIEELKKKSPYGILSCELARLINVDYAPRAVEEARKAGYIITDFYEDHFNHREKRYFYGGNSDVVKPKVEYSLYDTIHGDHGQRSFL